jgi:hypothetical protein
MRQTEVHPCRSDGRPLGSAVTWDCEKREHVCFRAPTIADDFTREPPAISSSPGKPIENADIESFNARFPDECLNENLVYQPGQRRAEDRGMEAELQSAATTQCIRLPMPEVFRHVAMTNCGNDAGSARVEDAARLPHSHSSGGYYPDSQSVR